MSTPIVPAEVFLDGDHGAAAVSQVARRVVRDLSTASALATLDLGGRRQILGWHGADPLPLLRTVGAMSRPNSECVQVPETSPELTAAGIGAHVSVPIASDDPGALMTLWTVSSLRRWFDHDEIHHLRLLADRISRIIAARAMIVLDREDQPTAVVTLS